MTSIISLTASPSVVSLVGRPPAVVAGGAKAVVRQSLLSNGPRGQIISPCSAEPTTSDEIKDGPGPGCPVRDDRGTVVVSFQGPVLSTCTPMGVNGG